MSVAPAKDFVHASNHAEKQPLLAYYVLCRVVTWKWSEEKVPQFWLYMNTFMYMTIWKYLSKLMFAIDDKIWIKGNKIRSENYVYFWTNLYIKLYTLCMADIVMLYSSLRRSAGGMAGDSLGPGPEVGKKQKTGSQQKKKKNGERSESRSGQLASLTVLLNLFSPLFSREKPWARRWVKLKS